jgi:hypothetical protein
MFYYDFDLEDCSISTTEQFARAVTSFPVYVYTVWNGSFHASDSYIVVNDRPFGDHLSKPDCMLVNNGRELLVAVQSLVDQRDKARNDKAEYERAKGNGSMVTER